MSANEALNLGAKAVLISPGPKTPDEAGMCLELLAQAPNALPILGICLGQQSIGQAFGGKVIRAKQIMHGKVSDIHHDNTGLFESLDNPFKATRYHSLSVERESLPDCLAANAWVDDGETIHGLQFHPESIASENGHALIAKFLQIAGLK